MGKEGTILAPIKSENIPETAQWLSGQGAGVWFDIKQTDVDGQFKIQRFSPEGQLDCDRVFIVEQEGFDVAQPYQFIHISHCAKCKIEQNNDVYVFNWVGEENN